MQPIEKLRSYCNGDEIHVRYTFKTDDITQGTAPFSKPYHDRKGYFDGTGWCDEAKARLRVSEYGRGLQVLLDTQSEELSEFGLSLPINFMGKKKGGGWENQYLLNSVFTSENNAYKYCYLTNPNGKNLMIFPKGACDGWKCDYTSDYCPGHFFLELEFLVNFDRAYRTGSENDALELYVFEVKDFSDALNVACETLSVCALSYEQSMVKIGEEITLRVHGSCDYVLCEGKQYLPQAGYVKIPATSLGLTKAIPFYGNVQGMECIFYAYDDIQSLYRISNDAVSDEDIAHTSGNLCESRCYMSAMLRYMLRYGQKGCEAYQERIQNTFKIILEKDVEKAIPRVTVFHKAHKGEPPYYIFESGRIQELLFGVTILQDAYRLTGEEEYFTYFTGALNAVLERHFEDGMIYTQFLNGEKEDYTTVCCLIIPFVDAAVMLKESHPALAARYREASKRIADYLYMRKGFHTEAFVSEYTEPEMEDGSISCTALALLYYCAKIEREGNYIARAKEILDLHEAWVTYTPIAPCFHSSLRWWETFWEGDATGASICYGHAWTIWRAEADYWYYYLTKDEKYRKKAMNGFASNLSKIGKNGKMFSCYLLDYIPGGGFHKECSKTVLPVRQGIPVATDSGLTRYVWVRAHESVLNEEMF